MMRHLCSSLSPTTLACFLEGPSQSGKSSIAMDVAYNIASSPPSSSRYSSTMVCNVCGLEYDPPDSYEYGDCDDSNQNNNFDGCRSSKGTTSCTCCAVTFLIPECKRSDVHFPLRCSSFELNEDDKKEGQDDDQFSKEETLFKERMMLLESDSVATNLSSRGGSIRFDNNATSASQLPSERQGKRPQRQSYWKEDCRKTSTILERIKVKYVKSRTDLILFLASVYSFPSNLKPWGGIVIDDLDFFIRGDADADIDANGGNDDNRPSRYDVCINTNDRTINKCGSTLDCMKMIQILAQLSDTREHFTRLPNMDDFSILTCINSDQFPLPKSIMKMIQNYLPTTATITRVVDGISRPIKGPTYKSLIPNEISLSDIQSIWNMSLDHYDAWRQLSLLKPVGALGHAVSVDEKAKLQVYYYITHMSTEGQDDNEDFVKEIRWGI